MSRQESDQKALVKAYFGDSPYHEEGFLKWKETGSAPFNWMAFFIGSWWFLYKKLIWVAATLLIVRIILTSIGYATLRDLITIGISIYAGFMGNAMDYQRLENTLEDVDPLNDVKRLEVVSKQGKPWKFVFVLFALDCVLTLYLLYQTFASLS